METDLPLIRTENSVSVNNQELQQQNKEQLVTFYIDNQLFGISILCVQDIVEPKLITPVPLAPSAIVGLLNLRGRIVTVINVRACLSNKIYSGHDVHGLIGVTVHYKGDLYTLLVDRVSNVYSFPASQLEPVPNTVNSELNGLSSGILQLAKGLLIVLDINRLLSEDTIKNTSSSSSVWRNNRSFLQEIKEKSYVH